MPTTDSGIQQQLWTLAEQARLNGLVDIADRAEQRGRDFSDPLYIMVVGEGKFGKSTLINALADSSIAPVSRLPKTWKVDVYEQRRDGPEQAWLYWRDRPDDPEESTITNALDVCDQQEIAAKQAVVGAASWQSNLFQVRWCVDMNWPGAGVALVDTPGFAQLRADTAVDTVNLYGSSGIRLAASDGFAYYYYRADVVCWCIKATKLEDQDTLETLSSVAPRKDRIVGVLTHMDRIPSERWEEIKLKAENLYGDYISEFCFAAAGAADSELRRSTICSLRSLLDTRFAQSCSDVKAGAAATYFAEDLGLFSTRLGAVMDCYISNSRNRESMLTWFGSLLEPTLADIKREVGELWDTTLATAESRLDGLWSKGGGDPARFGNLVSAEAIDQAELEVAATSALDRLYEKASADARIVLSQSTWDGVIIGGIRSEVFHEPVYALLSDRAPFRLEGSWHPLLTGYEGRGVQDGVGKLTAGAGYVLLGPIGLAAGILGFIAGALAKRAECLGKARESLEAFCSERKDAAIARVDSMADVITQELDKCLTLSMEDYLGCGLERMWQHSATADISMNTLGYVLPDRESAIRPRMAPCFDVGLVSYYQFALANSSQHFAKLWDSAVVDEWRQAMAAGLHSALRDGDAPLSDSRLLRLKNEYSDILSRAIENCLVESDAEKTAAGVLIRSSAGLNGAGIEHDVAGSLPNVDLVVAAAQSARLTVLRTFGVAEMRVLVKENYEKWVSDLTDDLLTGLPSEELQLIRYSKRIALVVIAGLLGAVGLVCALQNPVGPQSIPVGLPATALGVAASILALLLALRVRSFRAMQGEARSLAGRALDAVVSNINKAVDRAIRTGLVPPC